MTAPRLVLLMVLLGGALACGEAPQRPDAPPPPETDEAETVTLPSGLQYIELEVGTGEQPRSGQHVTVHYTGWLTDGTEFDSSVARRKPFQFTLGKEEVIPGMEEGVATMRVGGRRQLIIPYQLGYGQFGIPPKPPYKIPPYSTLIFDVQLLSVY